ncbi:MAG: DUF819 domain-containing protein [Thermoguttaceae bacterium]
MTILYSSSSFSETGATFGESHLPCNTQQKTFSLLEPDTAFQYQPTLITHFTMQPLISGDDTWLIWTFLVGMASLSLFLEYKYKWAKRVTGAVLALTGGMVASSCFIVPTECEAYDIVWTYLIPLVIPLLLIKMNVFTIFRETGRLLWVFHFAALGTVIGSCVAYQVLKSCIPGLDTIAPAMVASYIGGGVNFVAMVATFKPDKALVNATLVADSGIMVVYFLVLIMLPSIGFFRKLFPYTKKTKMLCVGEGDTRNENYWEPKPIGILDIAKSLFIALVIATISVKISGYFGEKTQPFLLQMFLGQKYLVLTTLSLIFPLVFPKVAESIVGNDEIATFFIFIFFVCLGVPASIISVIKTAPLMLLFCAIILFFNFLVAIVLGKLFKFELEEIVLAGTLTSGGPMNGVAISISMQWNKLIIPSMMVGIWGYIIGNYIGFIFGKIIEL